MMSYIAPFRKKHIWMLSDPLAPPPCGRFGLKGKQVLHKPEELKASVMCTCTSNNWHDYCLHWKRRWRWWSILTKFKIKIDQNMYWIFLLQGWMVTDLVIELEYWLFMTSLDSPFGFDCERRCSVRTTPAPSLNCLEIFSFPAPVYFYVSFHATIFFCWLPTESG